MKLKKNYNTITINFEILKDSFIIANEDILHNLVTSFEYSVLLNKKTNFNDLLKLQQKNPKFILIDNDALTYLDNYRLIIKLINSFLSITKQTHTFILDSVEFNHNNHLTVSGMEYYQGSLKNATFSPMIRSEWINSRVIEEIISELHHPE